MGLKNSQFDHHCHVFQADLPMVADRRYTPTYDALPSDLCDLLLKHNLDGALLIQPSFLGTDNSFLLNTLSHQSDYPALTLQGVVVLNPLKEPDKRTLEYMDKIGVIGIRLNLIGCQKPFEYSTWKNLLGNIEEMGWHIELHCEPEALAEILPTLALNHSNIVVDHFGLVANIKNCPGLNTILKQPADRLWIKASAPYRLPFEGNDHEIQNHVSALNTVFSDHLGADRVLWGSDWPFTQFEQCTTYEEMLEFGTLGRHLI